MAVFGGGMHDASVPPPGAHNNRLPCRSASGSEIRFGFHAGLALLRRLGRPGHHRGRALPRGVSGITAATIASARPSPNTSRSRATASSRRPCAAILRSRVSNSARRSSVICGVPPASLPRIGFRGPAPRQAGDLLDPPYHGALLPRVQHQPPPPLRPGVHRQRALDEPRRDLLPSLRRPRLDRLPFLVGARDRVRPAPMPSARLPHPSPSPFDGETFFAAFAASVLIASHSSSVHEIVYDRPLFLARGFLIPPRPLPTGGGTAPPHGPQPWSPRPRSDPTGRETRASSYSPRCRSSGSARGWPGGSAGAASPLAARRQHSTPSRETGIRSFRARRRILSQVSGRQ